MDVWICQFDFTIVNIYLNLILPGWGTLVYYGTKVPLREVTLRASSNTCSVADLIYEMIHGLVGKIILIRPIIL